jgi:hypothetical protein
MHYSFLWDTEPTDEQLETLMREVGEDVRRRRKKAVENFQATLKLEMQQAATRYESLLNRRTLASKFGDNTREQG